MKITEIINKVEKTTENECAIPVSIMWQSLDLPREALSSAYLEKSILECKNRLKGYWLQRHNFIVPFGFCVYFLDNEPIAISNTNYQEIENVSWINSAAAIKTKEFFSMFLAQNNLNFKMIDESEEISDTYKIEYAYHVSNWSKGIYNGIKVKKLIREINEKTALIELENGQEVATSMDKIDFLNNITD